MNNVEQQGMGVTILTNIGNEHVDGVLHPESPRKNFDKLKLMQKAS